MAHKRLSRRKYTPFHGQDRSLTDMAFMRLGNLLAEIASNAQNKPSSRVDDQAAAPEVADEVKDRG